MKRRCLRLSLFLVFAAALPFLLGTTAVSAAAGPAARDPNPCEAACEIGQFIDLNIGLTQTPLTIDELRRFAKLQSETEKPAEGGGAVHELVYPGSSCALTCRRPAWCWSSASPSAGGIQAAVRPASRRGPKRGRKAARAAGAKRTHCRRTRPNGSTGTSRLPPRFVSPSPATPGSKASNGISSATSRIRLKQEHTAVRRNSFPAESQRLLTKLWQHCSGDGSRPRIWQPTPSKWFAPVRRAGANLDAIPPPSVAALRENDGGMRCASSPFSWPWRPRQPQSPAISPFPGFTEHRGDVLCSTPVGLTRSPRGRQLPDIKVGESDDAVLVVSPKAVFAREMFCDAADAKIEGTSASLVCLADENGPDPMPVTLQEIGRPAPSPTATARARSRCGAARSDSRRLAWGPGEGPRQGKQGAQAPAARRVTPPPRRRSPWRDPRYCSQLVPQIRASLSSSSLASSTLPIAT